MDDQTRQILEDFFIDFDSQNDVLILVRLKRPCPPDFGFVDRQLMSTVSMEAVQMVLHSLHCCEGEPNNNMELIDVKTYEKGN